LGQTAVSSVRCTTCCWGAQKGTAVLGNKVFMKIPYRYAVGLMMNIDGVAKQQVSMIQ
jgi:hypothetical protein